MKKTALTLLLAAAIMALCLCACGEKEAPLPDDAITYEDASSRDEVTYGGGEATVILKADADGKLEWKWEIADESAIEVRETYILRPASGTDGDVYQVWVFRGLAQGSEIETHFYKTDKDGNTGFSGERIYAFNVSPQLEVSMEWGRLVVKSD